jgi:ubiquinone/menaquinone biosynthesis C-methylase UbiE
LSTDSEREYVLGTHDEEIARLGLQHRIWRSRVLECWSRAGLTEGWRVMDVGCGPGYATVDLAEIVGRSGHVTGIEQSSRFLNHAREACRVRGLENVDLREQDLMFGSLGASGLDATWCRWVASFVPDRRKLVAEIAGALKPGGVALFHEYIDYRSWRLAPRSEVYEQFVLEVMTSWRDAGGEPDVALELPTLLAEAGFRIRHVQPHTLTVRPHEYGWQWPQSFVEVGTQRLVDLGRVTEDWANDVRHAFRLAEANPMSIMVTPMVLEIVAERMG